VIVVIILVVGLILYFVKPENKPTSTSNAEQWAKNIIGQENFAEAAISFAIACMTLLGYLIWIVYTVRISSLTRYWSYSVAYRDCIEDTIATRVAIVSPIHSTGSY
jgi:hypothetical protein